VELREAARLLSRTTRSITEYAARGMPREADGRFDPAACAAWIEANIRPTGRAADAPIGAPRTATDRGYWETYKVREQALQEELKRKQLSGDLVEVDLVARQSERRITHAKALLAQVPDRVLGLLPKEVKPATRKQLRGRLAEMIDDVLFALAEAAEEEVTTDGEDSDSGD